MSNLFNGQVATKLARATYGQSPVDLSTARLVRDAEQTLLSEHHPAEEHGRALRIVLEATSTTQTQFAEQTGVSKQTISACIHGHRKASTDLRHAAAGLLACRTTSPTRDTPSLCIDWLQFAGYPKTNTTNVVMDLNMRAYPSRTRVPNGQKIGPPIYRYKARKDNIHVEWSPHPYAVNAAETTLSCMPARLSLDGWVLMMALIYELQFDEYRLTRIDIAADYPFIEVEDVRIQKPRLRSQREQNGQTLGARASNRHYRIYDRSKKEKENIDYTLLRIEARTRRPNVSLTELASYPDPFAGLQIAHGHALQHSQELSAELHGLVNLVSESSLSNVYHNTSSRSLRKQILELAARNTGALLIHPSQIFAEKYKQLADETVLALQHGVVPASVSGIEAT